jgi:hypothetical protein
MTSVLDCLEELAKAGKISAALADEAATIYRGLLDQGEAEGAAALAPAEAIRAKAKAREAAIQFCIANPDRIEDVKVAMTEQWREARAGRTPH